MFVFVGWRDKRGAPGGKGGGGVTLLRFCKRRVYSSRTSCSRGVMDSEDGEGEREGGVVIALLRRVGYEIGRVGVLRIVFVL